MYFFALSKYFVILIAFLPQLLLGQEVDCTIQVNYEAVATTNKDLLQSFGADIQRYLNNNRWGTDELDEKVKFTMNIFIKSAVGENRYVAQVFIGSQRPIYGQQKNSAVVRLFDEPWEFTYVMNRPINHNPYSFNDLTSFLDFYVYLVLGYDYDTYENLGGTPFFQKAADVASLGRSSGVKGWQQVTGSYSRTQLVEELMNPKFAPVRTASYMYHFTGLDSLSAKPVHARKNILDAVELIGKVKSQVDPRNLVIRAFFDTKYLELADLYVNYHDDSAYNRLSIIDPSHQSTYEQYRARRKSY